MAYQGGKRGAGRAASTRRTAPGTTGRVTPKGTTPRGTGPRRPAAGEPGRAAAAPASGRYTPPAVRERKVSPRWVPALMFALLGVGVLVIILNYLGVLPGGSDNRYLLGGLAAITAGFVTATQYR